MDNVESAKCPFCKVSLPLEIMHDHVSVCTGPTEAAHENSAYEEALAHFDGDNDEDATVMKSVSAQNHVMISLNSDEAGNTPVNCPVCMYEFPMTLINAHLDECAE